MDHRAHQSQHTAGALKALQRGPFLVKGVEQLGVDRVGPLDAVLVRRVARLTREVVGVLAVHLHVRLGGRSDRGECRGVRLLEQPLLDDVVGLVRRRRAPLVSHPTHDVLEPLQRFETVGAADLLGVPGHDLGVVPCLGGGDRDREQDACSALDGLGQRLREGELVVERTAREVVAADK